MVKGTRDLTMHASRFIALTTDRLSILIGKREVTLQMKAINLNSNKGFKGGGRSLPAGDQVRGRN
jgi:hypothetical protein